MKVSFVLPALGFSGGTRVLLEFASGLAERSHQVVVVSPDSRADWLEISPLVEFRRIPPGAWSALRRYSAKVWSRVLRGRFHLIGNALVALSPDVSHLLRGSDVTIATSYHTVFGVRSFGQGVCIHHAQHDEGLVTKAAFHDKWAHDAMRVHMPRMVNSTWLRSRLHEETGDDYPLVCPGIDTTVFTPAEEPGGARPTSDNPVVVSYCGVQEWKGFGDLVKAFKLVVESEPSARLVAYGAPPDLSYMAQPWLTYAGRPTDKRLVELYRGATAVVNPSWYESFPLPPLEAMACGSAVVTTNVGVEDYAFNGKSAVVVPPSAPRALAEGILTLIRDADLRQEMAMNGLDVARRFTWENAIENYERTLGRLVGSGHG